MPLTEINLPNGGKIRKHRHAARAPKVKAPTYTRLQLLDALGDAVSIEIISATDPVIKLIEKAFDAASLIHCDHKATVRALKYLVKSDQVPSFTRADKDRICAPITL